MDKLPFTIYDFFGYLASGFVLLVAIVAAFVGYAPLRHTPNTVVALLLVIAAYITGQVVANLAGDLIERRIVRAGPGMPAAILLGAQTPSTLTRSLLPGYCAPLPDAVRNRIVERAAQRGVTDRGESLFFHCHATMKNDAAVQARLTIFLNLYGFCRNVSLALVLAGIALAVGIGVGSAHTGPDVAPAWWLVASLVAAIGLFYRYLKFLRQFSVELLTSYAETT